MAKLIDLSNVNSVKNLKTEDLILLQSLLNSTRFIRLQNTVNGIASILLIGFVLFILLSKIMKIELYVNDKKII